LKQAAHRRPAAEQDETQRAHKLAAIQAVSTAISSTLALDNVLKKSCQAAVELFHADHSGLVIFDDNLAQGRVAAEYPSLIKTVGTIIPLRGVPAEEQLIASQQTLAIENVAGADSLDVVRGILLGFDIQSILFVPIVFQERVLGSFSLDAVGQPRAFTSEEVELCQIFASQVGVAIANAQLLAEAQQRTEQLESLRQTTLALTSNLNRESLLQTIIKQAIKLLDAKSGGIDVFHPDRDCLEIVAEYGRATSTVGQTIHLGKGIAGKLVNSDDPYLIVDNYYQWSQRIESFANQRAYGSVLAVKLKWQEQIIGVLYVDDEVGRTFSASDAWLLHLFADHAAIALINADLAAKDVDKLYRLEKLSQASREMMDNLENVSLRSRLNLIARHATEILRAEACSILLVKRPDFLSFEACFGYTAEGIELGREFAIRSGEQAGLTGHIAHEKTVFNAHGAALRNHFAVKGEEKPHVASGQCYSLLVLPLMINNGQDKKLTGLLRLDNKKDKAGEINPSFYFDKEDEWIANLFVDAAVSAIESAGLIKQLSQQKDLRDRLITNSPSGVVAHD
ncbi:MAG: GAF domain-containing protein, partial [Anaerolineae bacterium]